MVYVISQNGQPLMPTENHAKVRILLKNKKAKVIKRATKIRQKGDKNERNETEAD